MAHVREGMVPEELRGKEATIGGFCTLDEPAPRAGLALYLCPLRANAEAPCNLSRRKGLRSAASQLGVLNIV